VLSGIFEVPFKKFLLYNIPGVIVGCGEFIVVGYFFGDRYQAILWIVERYAVLTFLIVFGLIFGYHYFGKKHIHRLKHHVFGRESSAKKNHDGV
jgi:membrane protein DedA with SNARE-associated domain